MTSDEKLQNLFHQIQSALSGGDKEIVCPYCKTSLDFTPPLAVDHEWKVPTCCETFALATIEILKRIEQNQAKDLYDRIRDNAGGVAVFN